MLPFDIGDFSVDLESYEWPNGEGLQNKTVASTYNGANDVHDATKKATAAVRIGFPTSCSKAAKEVSG